MQLLEKLCKVHAPSGDESQMTSFLLNYINENKSKWLVKPKVIYGEQFHDSVILVFGKPRTAVFSHIDSIGFSVGYNNEIIKIGGPNVTEGDCLVGQDSQGYIEGNIYKDKSAIFIKFNRKIDRGTTLTFKVNFRETNDYIQSAYLDNRLGVYNCLQIAKNLKDGIIVFSTYEEHGGGSVGFLGKYIYEAYNVRQALISDITWITSGVFHGKGCAISMRDSGIPRRSYVNRILKLLSKSKIDYQIEVESAGGSDGNQLQKSSYPWDWCFVGAAEDNVHSPNEKVHKKDIKSMYKVYNYLLPRL